MEDPAAAVIDDASDWSRWPHFAPDELRCKGSGLLCLHPGFMDALDRLRVAFAWPMAISSGCRSAAHNATIQGSHKRSLHICDVPQHPGQRGTLAVDVRTPDGVYRGQLFVTAWNDGWSIGWGDDFLHLDRRDMVGLVQTSFDYF